MAAATSDEKTMAEKTSGGPGGSGGKSGPNSGGNPHPVFGAKRGPGAKGGGPPMAVFPGQRGKGKAPPLEAAAAAAFGAKGPSGDKRQRGRVKGNGDPFKGLGRKKGPRPRQKKLRFGGKGPDPIEFRFPNFPLRDFLKKRGDPDHFPL